MSYMSKSVCVCIGTKKPKIFFVFMCCTLVILKLNKRPKSDQILNGTKLKLKLWLKRKKILWCWLIDIGMEMMSHVFVLKWQSVKIKPTIKILSNLTQITIKGHNVSQNTVTKMYNMVIHVFGIKMAAM